MRRLLLCSLFLLFTLNIVAQKKHLKQSKPFEQVLKALKKGKPELFMNSFSDRIVDGETDLAVWKERIEEGQRKFGRRFPDYSIKDFRYGFDAAESKLIIYYKGKENFRMKVVKEGGKWKLNEK